MKNTLTLFALLCTGMLSGQSYDALQHRLDSILQKYEIPGAQVAVVDKDSILWIRNFGYADLAAQKPVTDQTMFRIGSITKSFVAV
ncbi:MAG TPA: serine hydrolase domain-containing protein, partial [Flavilitoribacter sp.]|nr:serine hydrolase domain-containing protein [Flavilitoribacter sp.]